MGEKRGLPPERLGWRDVLAYILAAFRSVLPFTLITIAVFAALLLIFTDPAFAADAPKTKAECEKMKDMKWDDATKACVKK